MLYIFDLGNVLIDIDFNRALGVWSNLSATPLSTIQSRFSMDESFHLHEKGQITDEVFAKLTNDQLGINLGFEQFLSGWNALLIGIRPNIPELLASLKANGDRLVMLSNTNHAHTLYWKTHFKALLPYFDAIYLSQEIGMRKPDAQIFDYVLQQEGIHAEDAIFFDDNIDNIQAAHDLGIEAILVHDAQTVFDFFNRLNTHKLTSSPP